MTRTFRFAIPLVLVLGIIGLYTRPAAAQPGGHPFITEVHADFDLFRLRIVGDNFGTTPTVWLAERKLDVESATNNEIYALLGGPIEPGSYLVTVAKDDKNIGTAKYLHSSFDATIGAQGPKGEKGDKGDQGEQGNPGQDGQDGVDGKDGKDGASPFTLAGNNAVYTQGNVGVGTDAPTALLQAGPVPLDFGPTTLGVSQRPTDTVGLSVRSAVGTNPTLQFCEPNNCNYVQMERATQNLWLGEFQDPSMVVQKRQFGGRVGIGTTMPTALFQAGLGQDYGNITTAGISQRPGDTVALSLRSSSQNPVFQFCNGDCNYVEMERDTFSLALGTNGQGGRFGPSPSTMVVQRHDRGGRVGIGTRTPERLLHLRHTDNNGVMMDRLNPGTFSGFQVHEGGLGNERWFMGLAPGPAHLVLRNRAQWNVFTLEDGTRPDAMYLRANGNLGLSWTQPSALLHVGPGQSYSDITTVGVSQRPQDTVGVSVRSGNSRPTYQLCLNGNPCRYMQLNFNGDLWFGDFNSPTMTVGGFSTGGGVGIHGPLVGGHALAIHGNVIAGFYAQFSSRRFKSDIETLSGALDLVGRMRGVTYTAKATGKAEVGVIAEEMYDVLPQVVAVSDGQVQGVEYSRLVAVLIEAVKEQQEQIKSLRQEMTSLAAALAAATAQK